MPQLGRSSHCWRNFAERQGRVHIGSNEPACDRLAATRNRAETAGGFRSPAPPRPAAYGGSRKRRSSLLPAEAERNGWTENGG